MENEPKNTHVPCIERVGHACFGQVKFLTILLPASKVFAKAYAQPLKTIEDSWTVEFCVNDHDFTKMPSTPLKSIIKGTWFLFQQVFDFG